MNGLDLLLLVLLAIAGVSGYRRGLLVQAFGFGGLLVGLAAGAVLAPQMVKLVESPAAQAGVAVGTMLALAAGGDAAGWLLGTRARARARTTRFGPLDAVGGSVVAVLASLLAIWFVALNLVNGPFPSVAADIRGSAIVRALDAALPEPPSPLAEVRRFFNRFGFPDVFTGIPPAPAEPVRVPTQAEAQAAFDAADQSTVRVLGQACDRIQEGSGFVVADGYVVTNAHVIAGVESPQIQAPGGGALPATTVLFDPGLDLAVLFVAPTPAPSLPVASLEVGRGAVGAVLGYPGGGPLAGEKAAVRRPIEAVGHDIYGRGRVEREVYELQAHVEPGSSGGPFVLADGSVAGVVFAASTTDPGVGYALASTEFLPGVNLAVGLTAPVPTGPCTR